MCNITFIGRHVIKNSIHYAAFLFHDILIPFAIVLPLTQLMTPVHIHKRIGRFFLTYIFPLMNLSGMVLTIFSIFGKKRIVPISSVFLSYGCSYYVFGASLTRRYFLSHFLAIAMYMYTFYHLLSLNTVMCYELFVLLLPCPVLHYMNIVEFKHEFVGTCFIYLGLIGTFFTISYDQFWFFKHLPTLQYRLLIQNIPLFFMFCVQNILPKRHSRRQPE